MQNIETKETWPISNMPDTRQDPYQSGLDVFGDRVAREKELIGEIKGFPMEMFNQIKGKAQSGLEGIQGGDFEASLMKAFGFPLLAGISQKIGETVKEQMPNILMKFANSIMGKPSEVGAPGNLMEALGADKAMKHKGVQKLKK